MNAEVASKLRQGGRSGGSLHPLLNSLTYEVQHLKDFQFEITDSVTA